MWQVESAERERERAKEEATRAVKEKDEAIKMLEAAKAEGEGMAEVLTARRGAAGSGIGSFNAIWDLDGTALACKVTFRTSLGFRDQSFFMLSLHLPRR
jgi:hypothetical protein